MSGQTTLLAQAGMSRDTQAASKLLFSSCSEEKAKLLREMMAKIEDKNEVLE